MQIRPRIVEGQRRPAGGLLCRASPLRGIAHRTATDLSRPISAAFVLALRPRSPANAPPRPPRGAYASSDPVVRKARLRCGHACPRQERTPRRLLSYLRRRSPLLSGRAADLGHACDACDHEGLGGVLWRGRQITKLRQRRAPNLRYAPLPFTREAPNRARRSIGTLHQCVEFTIF